MFTAFNINVSTHLAALIITLVLLMGTIFGNNVREKIHRWFFAILILNLVGILSEFVMVFLADYDSSQVGIILNILDYISYIQAPLQNIMFFLYFYEYINAIAYLPRWPVYVAIALSSLSLVTTTVAKLTNLYGVFDENNVYHQGELFGLAYLFTAAAMIFFVVLVIIYRRKGRRRQWFSLLSYPFVMLLAYIVEIKYEEIWIAYLNGSIICFLIYVNVQLELKQQMLIKDEELAKQRIAIMLSQIQPHFLYNTLNTIGDLCETDSKQAQEAVLEFSDYLRANMNSLSSTDAIPFKKELHHVKTYLALEKRRFQDRLSIKYDIKADDFFIPPLTVQPIVENAVLHGITVRRSMGTVEIATEELAEGFKITVSDDGVGFDLAKPLSDEKIHLGIDNVKSRLAAISDGTLEISSEPGKGTTVTIFIPHKEKNS